jgi:hypothetical protein
LPSNSSVILSILENYIPTVFATLLEPVWVILNRQLCLLKPFEELRKGNAKSSESLEATYSSLPPQLNIWRAVNSGHFLLAIVCLIALSNNILAVTLSTLVNEETAETSHSTPGLRTFLPRIKDSRVETDDIGGQDPWYSDHFYMLLANLTHNTSLPAWLDSSYYYLPFSLEVPLSVSTSVAPTMLQGFKAPTTGFGASVNCTDLSLGNGPDTYQFNISTDGSTAYMSTTHILPSGRVISCVPVDSSYSLNKTVGFSATIPAGALALEVMQSMFPQDGVDDGGFCASLLIAGWVRAIPTAGSNPYTGASNSTHFTTLASSSFVACTSRLQAAQFDIYVDPSGHILETNLSAELSTKSSQYFTGNATELNLVTEAVSLLASYVHESEEFQWHNTTATSDWMNSLLAIMQGSDALVDPSLPAPNGTVLASALEQLYTQLFGLIISLNADEMFVSNSANETTPVRAIGVVPRLFLDQTMFQVSMAILLLQLFVAVIFYISRPRNFLPRMPISIAAILSFVTASRALDDFADHDGGIKKNHSEQRYAYGRYIGTDGKSHVGIEQQRFVVPLESRNPEVRNRKWRWNPRKKDEGEPKTWI